MFGKANTLLSNDQMETHMMSLFHTPKHLLLAVLSLGLLVAGANVLCADATPPDLIDPETPGIYESANEPEVKRNGRWWKRLLATKTRENPSHPVETPAPAPAPAPRQSMDIPIYTVAPEPEPMSLPTPEGVEKYRAKLEDRLLERYNNLPEFSGRIARVQVILSRPPEVSMDGTLIRAEFDQLVYDNWGKRVPELEKEYYAVTFGMGGVQQVRSDPSIRIGLDMEKAWSEKAPLVSDPFRNVETREAFRPAPNAKMPSWWRPEFPELDR